MDCTLSALQPQLELFQRVHDRLHQSFDVADSALEQYVIDIQPYPRLRPEPCDTPIPANLDHDHADDNTKDWMAIQSTLQQGAENEHCVPSSAVRVAQPETQPHRLPLDCQEWP
jgi:hypothetical protein